MRHRSICSILVFLSVFMFGATAYAAKNDYPIESYTANVDKMINHCVWISGIVKRSVDGFAIYCTKRDYIYDTRENAIWFERRADLPMGNVTRSPEGQNELVHAVVKGKGKDGYAAEAVYLDRREADYSEDKVYQESIKEFTRGKYEEDTGERETVSYYRIVGDPWRYDGKKVTFEGVIGTESCLTPNAESDGYTMIAQQSVNGIPIDLGQHWLKAIERYEAFGAQSENDVLIAIIAERLHLKIDATIYMCEEYDPKKEEHAGVYVRYAPTDIWIVDKDIGRLKAILKQMNRGR